MIKAFIGIILFVIIFKVLKMSRRNRKFEIIMSITLIVAFIINTIVLIATDGIEAFISRGLPLFQCSLGMITQIYYLLKDKEPDVFFKNANAIAIIGSIMAIFFSTIIEDNFMEYLVCVFSHIIFLMISVYSIWVRDIRLKKDEYKTCVKILCTWNIFIFIINIFLKTNYSFVSQSPFTFYINPILVLICNTLLFIIFYFIDYKYLSMIKTRR